MTDQWYGDEAERDRADALCGSYRLRQEHEAMCIGTMSKSVAEGEVPESEIP